MKSLEQAQKPKTKQVQREADPQLQDEIEYPQAAVDGQPLNADTLRPADVLSLQRTIGNQAVQRMIAQGRTTPSVQRDDDSNGAGGLKYKPSSDYQLHLDPEIEAQIRAIEFINTQFQPDTIHQAVQGINLNVPPAPTPQTPTSGSAPPSSATPTTPTTPTQPSGEPAPARPASAGDFFKALQMVPEVKLGITSFQDLMKQQVKQDWKSLAGGEKATVVTMAIIMGGAAFTGAMTNEESRNFVFGQISGQDIPVPGVKGLSVKFNLLGDNKSMQLTLDLTRFLPALK